LFEPTITIENLARSARVAEGDSAPEKELRETVFESIVALDVPTSLPRVSFTFEATGLATCNSSMTPVPGRCHLSL
jgi:hypothetical protein